jgi:hypothetical protein
MLAAVVEEDILMVKEVPMGTEEMEVMDMVTVPMFMDTLFTFTAITFEC